METRIEIFVDDIWKRLFLRDKGTMRYNKIVNKISNPTTREIGHTNTFTLPLVKENIEALGLNMFNYTELSRSLNSKYQSRYFIEEKLIQSGFLVINNFDQGEVRVNFIDDSLDIIDIWRNTTYIDLIKSKNLSIPADYQTAITEMESYVIDPNNVLPPLGDVGTRGHELALFPNNLNAIGEQFQSTVSGTRPDDSFNPYQSRPIFNAKSVFDLACEAFDFTPIYDNSVDWTKVAKQYIVEEGLNEDEGETESLISYGTLFGPSGSLSTGRRVWAKFDGLVENNEVINVIGGDPITTDNDRVIRPDDIPNWVDPNPIWDEFLYKQIKCVFQPNLSNTDGGLINYELYVIDPVAFDGLNTTPDKIYSCWSNATSGGDVVFRELNIDSFEVTTEAAPFPSYVLMRISVNKSELDIKPANADELIGVLASVITKDEGPSLLGPNGAVFGSQEIRESFSEQDVITYDENGQYEGVNVDLTYAAPNQNILTLLKELMNHNGILMEIDTQAKTVLFFNYNIYRRQIARGKYADWSKYLLKYENFNFNTDYGNAFAINNEIGLKDPIKGNTARIILTNQGRESKNKEFVQNLNALFKDVESIKSIPNSTTPYVEYTNTGLGLVFQVEDVGPLTQINADEVSQGIITNLSALSNINAFDVSEGVVSWYNIVDSSVKAQPLFLLPSEVVRNHKLSEPIFLGELQGYWIIEEVAEYINESTPVLVKLIKINDIQQYFGEFNDDFNLDFKI